MDLSLFLSLYSYMCTFTICMCVSFFLSFSDSFFVHFFLSHYFFIWFFFFYSYFSYSFLLLFFPLSFFLFSSALLNTRTHTRQGCRGVGMSGWSALQRTTLQKLSDSSLTLGNRERERERERERVFSFIFIP